jgi:hypothetical protein
MHSAQLKNETDQLIEKIEGLTNTAQILQSAEQGFGLGSLCILKGPDETLLSF